MAGLKDILNEGIANVGAAKNRVKESVRVKLNKDRSLDEKTPFPDSNPELRAYLSGKDQTIPDIKQAGKALWQRGKTKLRDNLNNQLTED